MTLGIPIVVVAALMASLPCPVGTWCWDAVPGADGYVWMWSREPDRWSECQQYDLGGSTAFNDSSLDLLYGNSRYPGIVFLNVRSYNANGYSAPDHGTVYPCPVEVCP